MLKRDQYFESLKQQLQNCVKNTDVEGAHNIADGLLVLVALNASFTRAQRNELVILYQQVEKWYA